MFTVDDDFSQYCENPTESQEDIEERKHTRELILKRAKERRALARKRKYCDDEELEVSEPPPKKNKTGDSQKPPYTSPKRPVTISFSVKDKKTQDELREIAKDLGATLYVQMHI